MFYILNIIVYRAYHQGKVKDSQPWMVACTVLDSNKTDIIIDMSGVYLKGINFFMMEDQKP